MVLLGPGTPHALVRLLWELLADAPEVHEGSPCRHKQLWRTPGADTVVWEPEAAAHTDQVPTHEMTWWVIGESETSTWSSAWSLSQPFKSGRRGLLINPGDIEGDSLLHTSLGRVSPEFIPGRGYIVGRGKARKLQIALPPENRD